MDQKAALNMLLARDTLETDTHGVRIRGWNRISWGSDEIRKAGVAVMISDKTKA